MSRRATQGFRSRSSTGVAERLPADDGSFDAVVVMGVLCSVARPARRPPGAPARARPGGELRFWEHVRSGMSSFRPFQRVVDRLFWTRALGGCETTRDTEAAIRAAGFNFERLERGFHSSSLFAITTAPYIHGVAKR